MHAYGVVSEERESVSVVFLRSLMPLASPSAIGALLFFVGLLVVATSCSNYQQRAPSCSTERPTKNKESSNGRGPTGGGQWHQGTKKTTETDSRSSLITAYELGVAQT